MAGMLLEKSGRRGLLHSDWTVLESPLGWMAISFSDERLTGVAFGYQSPLAARSGLRQHYLDDEPATRLPAWVRSVQGRLKKLAAGESQDFSDVVIDTSHLTPLGRQILEACREIPWGRTLSYKQLAERVGRPGAARAVGNVMATNRYPLIVPCHRVVGSAGSLGGYSAPGGLDTKRELLAMEAVT